MSKGQMTINGKEYLTIEAAAKVIGCTAGYVRKLIGEGDERLSTFKLTYRVTMVLADDVRKFAAIPRKKTGRPPKNEGLQK